MGTGDEGGSLDPLIKEFVQNVLGCGCPEEVFEDIRYDRGTDPHEGQTIIIGNRLLVRLAVPPPVPDGQVGPFISGLVRLLTRGVEERDSKGLNRFRLVLLVEDGTGPSMRPFADMALFELERARGADDKVHIHVIEIGTISPQLRRCVP